MTEALILAVNALMVGALAFAMLRAGNSRAKAITLLAYLKEACIAKDPDLFDRLGSLPLPQFATEWCKVHPEDFPDRRIYVSGDVPFPDAVYSGLGKLQ